MRHMLREASWILKARLSIQGVSAALVVGWAIWIVYSRGLRGWILATWLIAPLPILIGSMCIAGPGRLFAKERYEGRIVLRLTRNDAVTALDLVGAGFLSAGILLMLLVVVWRLHNQSVARGVGPRTGSARPPGTRLHR